MKSEIVMRCLAQKIFLARIIAVVLAWGVAFTAAPMLVFAQPTTATYWLQGRNSDDAPLSAYRARRERVLSALSEKSFVVLFSADERVRQNDVSYEYRQNSDVFYCTGMNELGTTLLLVPRGITLRGVIPDSALVSNTSNQVPFTALLFVREQNRRDELWNGAITGRERAEKLYGIPTLESKYLRAVLNDMLAKHDTVYISELPTSDIAEPLLADTLNLETALPERVAARFPNLKVRSHKRLLGELRKIKDLSEVELLRKAINITIQGHLATIRAMRPKMYEYEAEAVMESTFKRLGAEDVGYASILGAGANSCVLHYTASRRQALSGEVLLMDCGAEYHNYTADITRTIPVGGIFSREQREIYNLVYAAQEAAIREYRKGTDWRKPHSRAVEVIRAGLLKLGIITNPDDYKLYFPHGSVHYIGLDVHDAGQYGLFQPNMVLTCEPGVYIPEGSPCDKKWWNIGVRIEDNILITNGDPVILSAALPRTADGIEKLMRGGTRGAKK